MPQQPQVFVENSFINGLITEATALNFPEKAVVDTDNCIFEIDGSVQRRTGFNFEQNYSTKTINKDNKAIKEYLWQNVGGDGNVTVVVVQVGNTIYFYETTGTGVFSTGAQTTTVTLTPVSGAPAVDAVEAQFTDGNGFLIVTHPYCDPIRVSYDITAHTAASNTVTLKIRDFEGATTDPYSVDTRPTTTYAAMNVPHKYNLMNQGWTDTNLTAWDTAQTTMPSNSDVMWRFKTSANVYDFTNSTVPNVTTGNTPAPNGHFILNLANMDRVTAIGASAGTVPSTGTSFQRPACCAFFAGRVFYSGINTAGFNSNIYFTQLLENVNQYGYCYQVNDPTAEDLFDILPSDGGVIYIPEAGTIYKMQTVPGGLCVFAANGVWYITGSTGIGFTATDYAVLKLGDISSISDTSFVNVAGFPAWWNSEGIYIVQPSEQGGLPSLKSLTYDTFKTFYDSIPVSAKRYARGYYDKTDGIIRWLYKTSNVSDINSIYKYDRILNYNVRTNAFYPWTISNTNVNVHGILSTELVTRPVNVNNVVDSGSNNVVDSLGNQVISFSVSGNDDQQFDKYLVSYTSGANTLFTFAERTSGDYKDWISYDGLGEAYSSYFISGYRLPGQGLRKAQVNWVELFSRLDDPVEYHFQSQWDFANTGSGTGKWSSRQLVSHQDLSYSNKGKRLKARGQGRAFQFKISSVEDNPFDILGWTAIHAVNGVP